MNTLKIKCPIWALDFFASFLQSMGHFDPLKNQGIPRLFAVFIWMVVCLPTEVIYAFRSQGIPRASGQCKRHLRGVWTPFLAMKGQGWYVYPRKWFIPPEQGFEPQFQNFVSDFWDVGSQGFWGAMPRVVYLYSEAIFTSKSQYLYEDSRRQILFRNNQRKEQQQVACQLLGIMV